MFTFQDKNLLATTFAFCDKMKRKIVQLKRKEKLTYTKCAGSDSAKNVLDLNKGSFSAGCRKVTGTINIILIISQ